MRVLLVRGRGGVDFLTLGIGLGSAWAYHQLGWAAGGLASGRKRLVDAVAGGDCADARLAVTNNARASKRGHDRWQSVPSRRVCRGLSARSGVLIRYTRLPLIRHAVR
ncbi:hypothetical protein ACNKHX_13795 [Shigella flexneri]